MKIKYKHFPSHLLLLCKYLHIYLTKWKLSPLVHTLVVASSSPQTDWQLNTTQFSLSNVSNTDDHVYDDDDNHIRTTYPENSWSISYETTNCRRNYKTVYFPFSISMLFISETQIFKLFIYKHSQTPLVRGLDYDRNWWLTLTHINPII